MTGYDELERYKWEEDEVAGQELIDFCMARSTVLLYYANGMNIVRLALKDESDPDWYKPFVEAQLAAEEGRIREKLELPSLFPNTTDSLVYGTFFEHVMAGEKNPFYHWSKTWPDRYLSGRGPDPLNIAPN
ncbi:hypothetical protein AB1K62_11705 [Parasphingorhabdus sp. JC815]|uniref:hypothetical protein n=1 Tax=Parasphingorhabdus sp. JC815 TaxID=3232140 RepID=UPI0034592E2F